jgi:hypothetical protein
VQADEGEDAVDRRPDLRRGVPVTSRANGDVLPDALGREELEVLEDDPDLARTFGTAAADSCARFWPSRTTWPCVAISSRIRSLISVDLPAPDGPTRKTKSPSGITRSTSRRAVLPFG